MKRCDIIHSIARVMVALTLAFGLLPVPALAQGATSTLEALNYDDNSPYSVAWKTDPDANLSSI